jgi:hypothetical protein
MRLRLPPQLAVLACCFNPGGPVVKLADRLVVAANYQGFSKQQVEAEIGDICAYTQNVSETARLRLDGQ